MGTPISGSAWSLLPTGPLPPWALTPFLNFENLLIRGNCGWDMDFLPCRLFTRQQITGNKMC